MRLVGRPRRLHVHDWNAGERRGEGEGKVRHACACKVWIRMGMVDWIHVGEKEESPGSRTESDRHGKDQWSTDSEIELVGSMETVIARKPEPRVW